MSNKISLLLSLVIFLQAFLLCIDVVNLQLITTRLTIESNYVNTLIAKNKEVNEEVYLYIDTVIKGELTCLSSCSPGAGKQLKYQITTIYKTVYRQQERPITITRSVLISDLA